MISAGWAAMWWENTYLGYIPETIRCKKLKRFRDIAWGSRCATSWCDLDLTFDLAPMLQILQLYNFQFTNSLCQFAIQLPYSNILSLRTFPLS